MDGGLERRDSGPAARDRWGSRAASTVDSAGRRRYRRQLNVDEETIVCFSKCDDGPSLRIVGAEFRPNLTLEDVPFLLDEFESCAGRIENDALLYPGA